MANLWDHRHQQTFFNGYRHNSQMKNHMNLLPHFVGLSVLMILPGDWNVCRPGRPGRLQTSHRHCGNAVHSILRPTWTPIGTHVVKLQTIHPNGGSGSLAFLVKPLKAGAHPKELRPIVLLEPTDKVTMGLIAEAILAEINHILIRLPQYACMANRSYEDAIGRVTSHCTTVRRALHALQMPIHQRAMGQVPPEILGGLVVSLDLTRAFDSINRQKLYSRSAKPRTWRPTRRDLWHRGVYIYIYGCVCGEIER